MVASARKSSPGDPMKVSPSAIADVVKVLARHNPGLSKTTLTAAGKVVAAVSAAAARLSADQQRRIVADERELAKAVEAAVVRFVGEPEDEPSSLRIKKPMEGSRGSGLSEPLDIVEGRRRLAAFATAARLEDWAGPVAGPGEIEKAFGTKRSTLHDWQKRGAVVGLLKGERKHVFPLAQFVDGRPVEGMAQVMQIIRNPRVAWQWLTQPKPSIGGPPLEKLKSGDLNKVLAAAERDFS